MHELSYLYDQAGRIKSKTAGAADDFLWGGQNSTDLTYGYSATNQLTTASGSTSATYTYDERGALVSDGVKTYTYDAWNRLTGDSSGAILKYDGLGRLRVVQTSSNSATRILMLPRTEVARGSCATAVAS